MNHHLKSFYCCKTRRFTWFLNDSWFTLSIVYYWLQNVIRFWENIRSWCDICVCLQRENELGVTQELSLQSRTLQRSDISGASYMTCPGTYPSSRIPSSHCILSCLRPLLFETHLIVLPFTLPSDTSPTQCQVEIPIDKNLLSTMNKNAYW